jgi:hypothetical protein
MIERVVEQHRWTRAIPTLQVIETRVANDRRNGCGLCQQEIVRKNICNQENLQTNLYPPSASAPAIGRKRDDKGSRQMRFSQITREIFSILRRLMKCRRGTINPINPKSLNRAELRDPLRCQLEG